MTETITHRTVAVTVTSATRNITIQCNQVSLVTGTFRKVEYTGDGVTTNFSSYTDELMRSNSEIVAVNSLLQHEGATRDYTVDGDSKGITFNTAPPLNRIVQLMYVVG